MNQRAGKVFLNDLLSTYDTSRLKIVKTGLTSSIKTQSSVLPSASLSEGVIFENLAIITENNLFGQDAVKQQRRRRAKHKDFDEAIKSLVEIQMGDPVVHEHYGVGTLFGSD